MLPFIAFVPREIRTILVVIQIVIDGIVLFWIPTGHIRATAIVLFLGLLTPLFLHHTSVYTTRDLALSADTPKGP